MLDNLKDLGFKYSTIAGITVSVADVVTSEKKGEIIAESKKMVDKINKQYQRGIITETERYNNVIDTWTKATDQVKEELQKLSIEFGRYKDRWDKLSRSIETVNKDVLDIHTTTEKISKRFDSINKVDIKEIESNEK